MENKKQVNGSSSSSFIMDHFGSKDSSSSTTSSSTGLFASVFGPSSTRLEREASNSGILKSLVKQDMRDQYGNPRYGDPDYTTQKNKGESGGIYNSKDKNSIYLNEIAEPCYMSSSIYYGGQEVYSSSSQPNASQHAFKKDGGDDDPNGSNVNGASRGNWWQGSLYY